MTRMASLWQLLTGAPDPETLRLQARKAYEAAIARGDTRTQHTTLKALQDATHAAMRGGR